MERWSGESSLEVIASEFWKEFKFSWTTLKTTWQAEIADKDATDEDALRAFEGPTAPLLI